LLAPQEVLTLEEVEGLQLQGGTALGTSRGGADIDAIVKRLAVWEVDMLFVIGGDGGARVVLCVCVHMCVCACVCMGV